MNIKDEHQNKITEPGLLSKNIERNAQYNLFLSAHRNNNIIVQNIIEFGYNLMRKAKLHHHYFGNSLLKTAQYLTFFSLKLPYEYKNTKYLNQIISQQTAIDIFSLFERRISERIPVEYITNEAWYLGNKFYVNENVLSPRSVMSTRFDDFLKDMIWGNNRVLDLCTGSGCIGITLALLNSKIKVDLLDISSKALEVANINIDHYHLNDRVKCIQSNLFEKVQGKYDLIITNPPYVSLSEYNKSPIEFKNEPKMALEAGVDGLDVIKRILVEAQHYLNTNGRLIAEVGSSVSKILKRKYPHIPFQWYKYRKPATDSSWFDDWVNRIFGLDCILVCNANDLSLLSKLSKDPFSE